MHAINTNTLIYTPTSVASTPVAFAIIKNDKKKDKDKRTDNKTKIIINQNTRSTAIKGRLKNSSVIEKRTV